MAKPELEFHDPFQGGEDWRPIEGVAGLREKIISRDPESGDYTRILEFDAGTDTSPQGTLAHTFWEEIWILKGSVRDLRLDQTFEAGMYACRPPGMRHGPWVSPGGALMLEFRRS
jgi:hypothetical protein